MKDYSKLKISLEGQLMGLGYYRALKALEIGLRYHVGFRKDDSPEFQHQVEIALYLLTLPINGRVVDREELIVLAFLHDVIEDYDVSTEDLMKAGFSEGTANRVYSLSKVYLGKKRDLDEVFAQMVDPHVALVKGADRIHNQGTMAGPFSVQKIQSYIAETKERILPMLKKARKANPSEARAFYNIENILYRDIHMYENLIAKFA